MSPIGWGEPTGITKQVPVFTKFMKPFISSIRVPVLVLVAALGITLAGWRVAVALVRNAEQVRFDQLVERSQAEIRRRLNSYDNALQGAVGLYAASKSVERGEWRAYVSKLNLESNFTGAQGLGFVAHVPRVKLDAFIATNRFDEAPEFTVKSQGTNDPLMLVTYIEPFAPNASLEGVDYALEPRRRAAAELSLRSGLPVVSEKVDLRSGNGTVPGFIYLAPVYRNGKPRATEEERRASIFGWVYAPVRSADLMQGVLEATGGQVGAEVFDGAVLNQESALYLDPVHDTPEHGQKHSIQRHQNHAHGVRNCDDIVNERATHTCSVTKEFKVGERTWTLLFSCRPEFARAACCCAGWRGR
jgi:CHASE1-domain containing sensor protein